MRDFKNGCRGARHTGSHSTPTNITRVSAARSVSSISRSCRWDCSASPSHDDVRRLSRRWALSWASEHQRTLYRALVGVLVAGVALNLYFLPSNSYYHKEFSLKQPFSRVDRARYMTEAAPTRNVIDYFNQAHPKEGVLLTHEGANAGLDGIIYENHWHQIATYLKIREAADVPAMLKLMNSWNVRYFI